MRAKAGIFILICLLFLIGTAGAAGTPATLIVTNNTPWIVANGISTSTITVNVTDSTGNGVQNVIVDLAVDSLYGTLSPSTVTTGPYGNATSTFSAQTKSGDPQITATNTTWVLSGSAIQHLDHDTPYYDTSSSPALYTYPEKGNVSEEIDFTVSMHDRWGNVIDNRTGNHLVGLHVFSTLVNSDCAFNNSNVFTPDITLPLDANGNLIVPVRLTSKIGINYIRMNPVGAIAYPPLAYITVLSQGIPVSMTGTISNEGVLPANGLLRFVIDYHLIDAYGNPMAGKSIKIHTNITGEQTNITHTADSNGLIRFYYGPKVDRMGVNITAVAADNESVTNHILAKFVADDPKNMVLTAVPQNLMSLDTNPDSLGYVRATVVDMVGNPVEGQPVSFSLGPATGDVMSADPYLDADNATTDANGNAIVHLIPGRFPLMEDPGYTYKSRAIASAVVTGTWQGINKQSVVTWRNYPFLDVQVSANKTTDLRIGDPVDITVTVTGNGLYREGGGKIAAILDLGNDQTIWSSTDKTIYEDSGIPCLDTENYPAGCTPIDSAKNAANVFAENLLLPELTGNWIGVTTFGGKLDTSILDPQARLLLVKDKIASITEPDSTSANFKSSILNSISTLEATQPTRPGPDSIRAVIILKEQSQGGANLDESDISSIITEAEKYDPNTRIFTVYYDPSSSQNSDCRSTSAATDLQALSDGTNGKCYAANSADQLALVFKEIADFLKYAAGSNTQLNINFQNMEVNSNATTNLDSQVFSYVPVGPFYTLHDGAEPDAITSRTRIMWPNATNSAVDQTQDWIADHQLHFDIGVVNISEVWAATYTLRPEQSGFINLFNCTLASSKLIYDEPGGDNVQQSMCIPELYVKVDTDITLTQGELIVSGLTPQSGNYSMEVPMAWNLKYTGPETVTETYWYSSNNGQSYVQFGSQSGIKSANGVDQPRSRTLSLDGLPDGSYRIEVVASVPGMPSSSALGGFTKVNQQVMIELK